MPLTTRSRRPRRAKRTLALAILMALAFALLPAGTALALPDDDPLYVQGTDNLVTFSVQGAADTTVGRELLDLINAERRKVGESELAWDAELEECALTRAIELALSYSHTRPDQTPCSTAWPKSASMWAENIAVGYREAASVHAGWMESAGHRENIFSSTMHSFAAAEFTNASGRHFWVECFSDAKGSGAVAPAVQGTLSREVRSSADLVAIALTIPEGFKEMTQGESHQLVLTVNEVEVTSTDVEWKTYDPTVASVSATGVVTALSAGTTQAAASLRALPSKTTSVQFTVKAAPGISWKRLAGVERYQTMATIVREGFATESHAVVATGANFPDALAASALAGATGSPVILTAKSVLSEQARSELKRLGVTSVDILGGTSAVGEEVEEAISALGIQVTRIAGADRVGTSVEVLTAVREAGHPSDSVIVATGYGFADSLSIGPWAYATGTPIILASEDGTLTDDAAEAITSDPHIRNVVIVGGDAVVSDEVIDQLGDAYAYTRLGGANRYETSAGIAQFETTHGMSFATTAVATGQNFPDALAGSALLGSRKGVILLVSDGADATVALISAHRPEIGSGYILGGESAVSAPFAQLLGSAA